MKRSILGVQVDDLSLPEVLSFISDRLTKNRISGNRLQISENPLIVVTPGPEFLLSAKKDPEFKKILNSADLAPNESAGLKLFCGFKNRVAGVDLMLKLVELSKEYHWSLGLFGAATGVAEKTKKVLEEQYPGINISYALDGEKADEYMRYYDTNNNIAVPSDREIKPLPPVDILFVNLGHPKQEKLLWNIVGVGRARPAVGAIRESPDNRAQHAAPLRFRLGLGVGGSFDLISGTLPRAPKIFQALYLEWLWRGMTKPGHWVRALRATVGFWLALVKYAILKDN